MDDTLQRLLDTELRAEKIAKNAEKELDKTIQEAIDSTRADIERFEENLPNLRASLVEKAEKRAEQGVADIKLRYDNKHTQIRKFAEERGDEALDAAFAFLIDPASDLAVAGN
ncbi:ATPase [Achromatium sp. WMS3]|nr:ATPase [Achromatium sp. WMS3]